MRYPERRQHIRILTLKNFAKFLAVVAVFFAGLSIEYINRDPHDDYGRLVRKEIPRNDDVRPQPQVVTEGPVVADETAADPMLLAPAARQQEFLSTTTVTPVVPAEPPPGTIVIRRAHEAPKRQPILAGGIFKQRE